jgi:hypothetical protein
LKKLDLFNLHPNLIVRLEGNDLGGFIAELLQSQYELEKQLESVHPQTIIDKEQLRVDQEQLKRDQESLLEDKNQLMKFQSFIMKLSGQIEESGKSNPTYDYPLPKRGTID